MYMAQKIIIVPTKDLLVNKIEDKAYSVDQSINQLKTLVSPELETRVESKQPLDIEEKTPHRCDICSKPYGLYGILDLERT